MDRIYLDCAATTPLDQTVFKEMLPYFEQDFGNPSSAHYFGQVGEEAVEKSRTLILELLNAGGYEVCFTSGGSESDNLAIRGIAFEKRRREGADTILYSSVEHPALKKTVLQMKEMHGFKIAELRVDNNGLLDLEDLQSKLNDRVALVSVIHGNNEIGTLNPVKEIAQICHQKGVMLHIDAVQSCAHEDINLNDIDADLMSMSAHKFYGPKGVGALVFRKGIALQPQISGGGQESGFRAGTHNVPSIVGMAKALELTYKDIQEESNRLRTMRDRIIDQIFEKIQGSQITGDKEYRLPNHASFVISGVNGNTLLMALDMAGFAVSSGSACKVGNPKPSDVLIALGIPPGLAMGSLRVTLGRMNTSGQVEQFINVLPKIVEKLRSSNERGSE